MIMVKFRKLNSLPCLKLLGRTLCGEEFKNRNVKCLDLFVSDGNVTLWWHYLAPAHDNITEVYWLGSAIPLR